MSCAYAAARSGGTCTGAREPSRRLNVPRTFWLVRGNSIVGAIREVADRSRHRHAVKPRTKRAFDDFHEGLRLVERAPAGHAHRYQCTIEHHGGGVAREVTASGPSLASAQAETKVRLFDSWVLLVKPRQVRVRRLRRKGPPQVPDEVQVVLKPLAIHARGQLQSARLQRRLTRPDDVSRRSHHLGSWPFRVAEHGPNNHDKHRDCQEQAAYALRALGRAAPASRSAARPKRPLDSEGPAGPPASQLQPGPPSIPEPPMTLPPPSAHLRRRRPGRRPDPGCGRDRRDGAGRVCGQAR